eukprot:gene30347-39576_t
MYTEFQFLVWGDEINIARTGETSTFYVNLTLATKYPSQVKGVYFTLESDDTVIGVFRETRAVKREQTLQFDYVPYVSGNYRANMDIHTLDCFIAMDTVWGNTTTVTGKSIFDDRNNNPRKLCENTFPSQGVWLKCGSHAHRLVSNSSSGTNCLRYGGMIFVPYDCNYKLFTREQLLLMSLLPPSGRVLPPAFKNPYENSIVANTQHSIVFLGNSITRGVYFSLVDHLFGSHADGLESVAKCWGTITMTLNNLTFTYQDTRSLNYYENYQHLNSTTSTVECHDNKVAVEVRELQKNTTILVPKFFASGVRVLVFTIFTPFKREQIHAMKVLLNVPTWWTGKLVGLNFRDTLNGNLNVKPYPDDLREEWVKVFGREVVIIDGLDLSSPFLRHFEFSVHRPSQHYHNISGTGNIHVFSQVTDMFATIVMNALFDRSEEDTLKEVQNAFSDKQIENLTRNPKITVCQDCPLDLLPFHLLQDPQLVCRNGFGPIDTWQASHHAHYLECNKTCMLQAPKNYLTVGGGKSVAVRKCYQIHS